MFLIVSMPNLYIAYSSSIDAFLIVHCGKRIIEKFMA